VLVSADNNNKFYNMKQTSSDSFTSEWGRIDVTKTSKVYSMSRWNSTHRAKLKKGYVDKTDLFVEDTAPTSSTPTQTQVTRNALALELQAYANHVIRTNYKVTADQVSQLQIDTAQALLNKIAVSKLKDVNDMLIELYGVIPRRMGNVRDHLMNSKAPKDEWNQFISKQQDILDALASQVRAKPKATKADAKADAKTNDLLDSLGLTIGDVTSKEVTTIKKLLAGDSSRFSKAYRVINKNTQGSFDSYKATKPETTLLFHGSRNENWWSILQTGLVLRPTNAVISGKMFGYGIYFAPKAKKSIGYSSYRGSYWASGNADKAYIALFEVRTGKELIVKRWESGMTKAKLKDCDSLHAVATGGFLMNDEVVIYNQEQCTIKYLIELK